MSDKYDRQGKPLSLMDWVAKLEDREYQRVAEDEIGDVKVSTVWLGLNHNFGVGPPLIFETMIFGGDHDGEQWCYSTEQEALAGHARAAALVIGEEPT